MRMVSSRPLPCAEADFLFAGAPILRTLASAPDPVFFLRMKPRVTTSDIARVVGLHQTTVSLALRGDRRLRPETIARIKSAAEKLGYVPDPMLTALASYRRSRRPRANHSLIAWITNWPTRQGWLCRPMFVQFYEGARQRASELGYRLEEFWCNTPKISPKRFSQILYARSVQGLILAPQPDGVTSMELNWPHFSAVTIGPTLRSPLLHMVTNDQYRTIFRLCEILCERGYRRIGYAIEKHHDERMNQLWSAAFDRFQRDLPANRRTTRFEGPRDAERIRSWLLATKPDVVFDCEEKGWSILKSLRDSVGFKPDFALIGVTSDKTGLSGMSENAPMVGAVAVDRLAALLHLGEVGIPSVVTHTLLESHWVNG